MKSRDDHEDPRDSRPAAGWVSLCLAPLYHAIEDLQELRNQKIIVDNKCIYTEKTWPRNPRTNRRVTFVSGSYGRASTVNELLYFLQSTGLETIINASGIQLNTEAVRDKLKISNKNDTHRRNRRTGRTESAAPKLDSNAIPSTPSSGSEDLCRTVPAITTGLTPQPIVTPAEPEFQNPSVLMGFPSVAPPVEEPLTPVA